MIASARKYTCPGIVVDWTPGSVWDSYPYQVHTTRSLGWQPIAFSEVTNSITIRARSCLGESVQDSIACKSCATLPSSGKFRDFVDQAAHISNFTHWEYLSAKQLQAALRQLSNKCQDLQTKVLYVILALFHILTHFLSC
jgi:hypothetical protein